MASQAKISAQKMQDDEDRVILVFMMAATGLTFAGMVFLLWFAPEPAAYGRWE
jgi:hypothetical protein